MTSSNVSEAFNFGRERHYEHDARYDRAIEFVEVVKGLWDSWDDDAFVRDRKSERYFDPAKLHYLNHKGEHFSVRGPLNVARPPQGHPVLFQAGSSEVGREVAARFAEGVSTPQHSAQEFYRDLKERMRKYARPPEALKVMPGLNAIVGRTRKEAEELHRFLQSKVHPDVGLELLSKSLSTVAADPWIDGAGGLVAEGKRNSCRGRRCGRFVPVHPELERLGFLSHWQAMKKAGRSSLFPDLRPGANGYYSDPFSKWFGRYLKGPTVAAAYTKKTTFHSLRHNYRDALRDTEMSGEMVRALGGWAGGGSTSDDYGSGFTHPSGSIARSKRFDMTGSTCRMSICRSRGPLGPQCLSMPPPVHSSDP